MAAPTIRGSVIPAIVTNGDVSITSPAGTQVGDLCIFFCWTQGADSTTITHTEKSTFFPWFKWAHNDGTTDGFLSAFAKKATQAGAQSYTPLTIANGTASQSALGMIVLTAGTYSANLDTVIPQMGTAATSTNNAAPDCPVVPASGSLTGDFLILAIAAWHVTTAGSTQGTAGANYTIEIQNANASHVTHLAVKRRALTGLSAATENPPAWTDNVTPNGTAVQTIAIRALVEHTTSVAVDGGSTLDVSAPTVEVPAGAVAFDGGGSFAIADVTVSAGFTEYFTSTAIDGGSGLVVGAPKLNTTTSAAIDGASSLVVAAPAKATATAVAIDGGASFVIAAPAKATTTSLAVDGVSALTTAAPSNATTTSVAIDGGSGIAVDATIGAGAVEHTTSVVVDGAGSVAVGGSTRATSSAVAIDGDGAMAIGSATRETFTSSTTANAGAIVVGGLVLAAFTTWACDGTGGATITAVTVTHPVTEYTTSAAWDGDGAFAVAGVDKSRPEPKQRQHRRVFSAFTRSKTFARLRRRR